MKITKLVHSCILVEQDGKKALVDPGIFSWKSGVVKQGELRDIDYVLITHGHPDHYHEDFVNVVNELSPNALWYAPDEVVEKLKDQGIKAFNESELGDVRFIKSEHADGRPWFDQIPEHTSFVVFDKLLISGDHQAHTTMEGASVLAGAFTAPWGSVVQMARMIDEMKVRPKKYIPLHDWHTNDSALLGFYEKAAEFMSVRGVEFIAPKNGISFEV